MFNCEVLTLLDKTGAGVNEKNMSCNMGGLSKVEIEITLSLII